jgi:lambda family phage tail tape measure protein
MASVRIDLSLEDTKGSIRRRKSDVQDLNKELEKTKRLSTRSGSQAVKASMLPTGVANSEIQSYGQARGSMGSTGAAGRDFANQAQGLGGLVRLYATYAANVFALTAAFSALSRAMNTTNMVKGLDQLGAASGVALGTLARRFEEASGGAISFRESMESTAKAVSAGLTESQFLKLGKVAKQASQALGVGMADAVSRLTRGITKLEPELLDELGIFTKIGPATEDYARSVGKSAAALTDFERRQAFANAVLAEGAKKFGEIDIPTNPYDKLLATLKNVAQSILEVVNVAVVPLVNLLSTSPAALTLGIAALGSTIVKQALPAIGEYRKSLRQAATVQKELSDAKLVRAESAAEARRKDIETRAAALSDASVDKIDALEKRLLEQSSGRVRKDVKAILAPTRNILDIKDTEIAKLDKIGDKLRNQDNVYKQLAKTIKEAKKEAKDFAEVRDKLDKERLQEPSRASTIGVLRAQAEAQRKRAASSQIISEVGDRASIDGFRVAFTDMVAKIKTEKLGLVRASFTGIAGAANAAIVRLGGLVSAFNSYLFVITGAIAIYQMLSGALSKNSAEQEKFQESVNSGNEAVKALNLTVDRYKGTLTTDSVVATATAFTNLAENISATVKALDEANTKAGIFDKFIDSIKVAFGKGLKADFEKGIAFQVSEGLKGITDPKIKKLAETQLKQLLNINTLTSKSIREALDDIDRSQIIGTGKRIADVFEAASRAGQRTAAVLSAIKEGFIALDKEYTTLANTLIQKDPLSNFGKELAMQGFNLAEAFKDPVASVTALRDILTDVSKIKLLAPESQQILMQNKAAFIALADSAEYYQKQIATSEANTKILEAKLSRETGSQRFLLGDRTSQQLAREKASTESARSQLADIRQGMEVIAKQFAAAGEQSIKRGFEIIERSFVRAMADASLSSQKTLLDMLPKTAGTIDLGVSLENQKLELQKQEILETQRLIKELELSRLSAEKLALESTRDKGLAGLAGSNEPNIRAALINAPEARLKEIEERTKVLNSANISRDTRSGLLARTPETRDAMMQQQGAFARISAIATQQQMNIVKADIDKISAAYAVVKRDLDNELKQVVQDRDSYMRGDGFREDTLEQQQATLFFYAANEAAINKQISLLGNQQELATAATVQVLAQQSGWKNIVTEAGKAVDVAKTQLYTTAASVDTTRRLNVEETGRKNQLELQLEVMKLQNIQLDRDMQLTKLAGDTELALLGIQKQELQLQVEKGIITVDVYNQQVAALERVERVKQRDLKLSELLQKYTIDTTTYLNEYAAASAAQRPELQAKFATISQVYQAEVNGIQTVFDATEKLKEQQQSLSDRQMAYTDLFKGAFKSMEDAIVEFTKTGKLSFSSMIESFIEGLIRYEIEQQQRMLFQGMGGARGLGGMLMGAVTNPGRFFDTNAAFEADWRAATAGLPKLAKGGAFDYGIPAFAKGGAFTNQIVDSPTLFKFARGTGLMGEAGPEAIMPLKRDSNGNLGVRAQGGGSNVEVVVNNYSTAQAETRETTDSRGNRRIEVIVGDMVAQEVSKTGSATQNAFSSTYGTRPALARR